MIEGADSKMPNPNLNTISRIAMIGIVIVICYAAFAHIGSRRANHTLKLFESQRLERLSGMDTQGNPVFAKYNGKRRTVIARVASINLPRRSPSIAIEDATATFNVEPGQEDVTPMKCKEMVLYFDEHGVLEVFSKGDIWEIDLSDKYELVALRRGDTQRR